MRPFGLMLATAAILALIATTVTSATPQPADHSVNGPIKFITVGGTYYSAGYQVGSAMTKIINSRLKFPDYQGFAKLLTVSPGASHLNNTLYATTLAAYPELIDELQGLADGAGLSMASVWLMNIVDELGAYQRYVVNHEEHEEHHQLLKLLPSLIPHGGKGEKKAPIPQGDMHCTDVFTNEQEVPAWGHNEDSGLYDVNHTYMVRARIYNNGSQNGQLLEEFQSYTYAGSVAGKAYQWNQHGILFSCNALFATELAFADMDSLPRAVHNRVILRSKSVEEAISLAQGLPSTTSYSLNVGYAHASIANATKGKFPFQFARYRNIEIWPLGKRSVTEIYPKKKSTYAWKSVVPHMPHHFYHTNDYEVLNVSYFHDPSSIARLARLNEFPVPQNMKDIRTMLGDTKNKVHPLYRYGTNGGYTMSTVIFNFESHTLDIYTANPKNHTLVMSFPMDMNKDMNKNV